MTQTSRKHEFTLLELGWTPEFQEEFEKWKSFPRPVFPARVLTTYSSNCRIAAAPGQGLAPLRGNLRLREGAPVAGDWVVCSGSLPADAVIEGILARRSRFNRKAAADGAEQVVAANIDTVFLVMSLSEDYNLRRLERYLAAAWESGATPAVLLTKKDLVNDWAGKRAEVESIAWGAPVLVISSREEYGLEDLRPYLQAGKTVALVGSSGVGKSTLVNCLRGEEIQPTLEVRASDGRGRHATSRREMFLLPQGTWVLDTPGMRELQLWEANEGVETTFQDIQELALHCRFSDCSHRQEPGCAVRKCLEDGSLDATRFANYEKLQKELDYQRRRADTFAARQEKLRWRSIHKQQRQMYKEDPRKRR